MRSVTNIRILFLTALISLATVSINASGEVFIYRQGFANDSGSMQTAASYGWFSYFGNQASNATNNNRIHFFVGAEPIENVGAISPFGENIPNGSWTGNSTAVQLAYTELSLTAEQAAAARMVVDVNHGGVPMPTYFAIKAGGDWYINKSPFLPTNSGWMRFPLVIGEGTKWVPISFTAGSILARQGSPVLPFSEIDKPITAVGVYIEPSGTHRFDNFTVILPESLVEAGIGIPVPTPPPGRDEMLSSMLAYFGPGPTETVDPMVEELDIIDEVDHRRIHLRYLVDENEFSYAYLMLPFPLPDEGQRLPLVLALHPTSALGKDRVAGIYDSPPVNDAERLEREARQYALDLVRMGFVVFAPDRAAFGERRLLEEGSTSEQMSAYRDFLSSRYPGFRLTSGKNVWDLQRALEFLVEMPFVDTDNIGAIGHSLGAWDSIMIAGMDERIRAAVVNSGGMVNFREDLWTDPEALRDYLNGTQSLTENVNIWMMLTAPRSLLYLWSLQDPLERERPHMLEGFRKMTDYWQTASLTQPSFNRADLNLFLHGSGHDFPPEARALAYEFLSIRLNLSANSP